jgi:hypothetical protein
LLNPLNVRFSQPRIAQHFCDGHLLEKTAAELYLVPLQDGPVAASTGVGHHDRPPYDAVLMQPFPAISVVSRMSDIEEGESSSAARVWYALDNRRLWCLQQASAKAWPRRCCAVVRCVEEAAMEEPMAEAEGKRVELGDPSGGVCMWWWLLAAPADARLDMAAQGMAQAADDEQFLAKDLWDAAKWAPKATAAVQERRLLVPPPDKDDRVGSDSDTGRNSGAGSFCDEHRSGTSWRQMRTPSSGPGSFCEEHKPGTSWMRMRTPSPESPRNVGAAGYPPPLPPGNFLEVPTTMSQQLQYITAVVKKAPWWTKTERGKINTDTPSTGAVADSKGDCGICEQTLPGTNVTAENAPSKGSIGHPHHCSEACKYNKKARGCKDGADCDRCHLCVYNQNKPRKSSDMSLQSSSNTDASPVSAPARTHARPKRRTRSQKEGQAQA